MEKLKHKREAMKGAEKSLINTKLNIPPPKREPKDSAIYMSDTDVSSLSTLHPKGNVNPMIKAGGSIINIEK